MEHDNVFLKYLTAKVQGKELHPVNLSHHELGPVITISREIGCNASKIAKMLVEKINERFEDQPNKRKWIWINKEILEKSALDLKKAPDEISHIFDAKHTPFLEDLFASFITNYYVSDSYILMTIKSIIREYAHQGNVVIVGRAGSVITNYLPRSLHIKLFAPVDYRVKLISEHQGISHKEASEIVKQIDHNREAFIDFFRGKHTEREFYDVIINRRKFNDDLLVDCIIKLADEKKLI
jgi:cytidylate kinase